MQLAEGTHLEDVSERTVSRYVKQLREEYGLKKSVAPLEYGAVPELPMGKQMQVDFGQKMMPNVDGGQTRVYEAAFVLSRSRYKYAQEQSRPFTSVDLVRICHDCFQYMGGMPEELVFDQDSIVCVSENAGAIIYTYEFEKFRQECGLSIRMCRGADPESKGKVENVVKYIKGNFLSHGCMWTMASSTEAAWSGWSGPPTPRCMGPPNWSQRRYSKRSASIFGPCRSVTR